ncbi:uncharacterized protein LOC116411604 [Xenopus tropicalis]|uniref:Uncharacterized protein LOC116411604 n=1 Tax=Xenopus tropicalis TaxID=8364 RepID=A0A8J1JQ98_XENTR|nr:uncharacterized protein LOC116411604 [Xenopus tropicalis]
MGPNRPFVFMVTVIGLLLSCKTASAGKHITLFQHKITLKAHTRNLIPCMFDPELTINSAELELEWGKVPVGGGEYTPLIHLYNNSVETFPEDNQRYQLFVSLVPSGNCTMIIDPTETMDSGTYEFWISVNKVVYKPASKIKIDISDEKKTSSQSRSFWPSWMKKGKKEEKTTTAPTTMTTTTTTTTTVITSTEPADTDSSDSTVADIAVMIIVPVLVIVTIMLGVVIYLYCKLKRKVESGDEENPQVSTPAAQSPSATTLKVEDEIDEEETDEEEETEEEETEEEEETDDEEEETDEK